jgi:hypothetical protein
MYEDAFSAGQNFKSGLRRAVREILVFWVLATIACPFILKPSGTWPDASEWFVMGIIVSIPASVICWAVYRILRFALAR